MRMGRNAVLLSALALGFAGSVARAQPVLDGPAATGAAWQRAWNAWQPELAAALFTEDAVFCHASGERVVGRPAIAALFRQVLAVNRPHIDLAPVTAARAGHGGWVSGQYSEAIARPGKATLYTGGKYLLVMRQEGGAWRIERMMWTDAASTQ